jgi:hypothetical protein
MFVRFVITLIDPESQVAAGLFIARDLFEEEEASVLFECYQDRLDQLFGWFNSNLQRPTRLFRSVGRWRVGRGICWFKPTAHQHIGNMWELAAIYDPCGFPVMMLQTSRPGYLLYEDEFQIVAQPKPTSAW